jgi:BirA family biotin operon repressor/biotin-[acetyl-CoA-carboxylase] ligase
MKKDADTSVLTADLLREYLGNHPYRYYESVDSSNDVAAQWLRSGAPEGGVVVADEQHKGRGRLGRTWHTPPGVALALSFVLRPSPDQLTQMSMVGAVAAAELCEWAGASRVTIKWPNDVLLDGRKVCGVLPEAVWRGSQLEGVILGIGVNVRMSFDAALAARAVNLEDVVSARLERAELAAVLVQRVMHWRQPGNAPNVFSAWKSRLAMLGRRVSVDGVVGTAANVDESGGLVIVDDAGIQHRVIAGDVLLI